MKLVALIILFAGIAYAQPPLPKLPSAFSVDIEANIIPQMTTLNLMENYNFNLGMVRYDINNAQQSVIVIEDFIRNKSYTIQNNNCTIAPLTSANQVLPSNARSTEDLLNFGAKYNYTYSGVMTVRGVPCDSWISLFSYTDPNGTNHTLQLQYFFTVSTWGFRAQNVTTKPMRAILNGTRTYTNGTNYGVYNYYEFVNFVGYPPLTTQFTLPDACLPLVNKIVNLLGTSHGQSLAAGMFFLGLFLGILFTAVSIWIYCRRRQQRLEKFRRDPSTEMESADVKS